MICGRFTSPVAALENENLASLEAQIRGKLKRIEA
jgi:hypothetical protein